MPLTRNSPADLRSLNHFSAQLNFKLPNGYLEFISKSNGAEGQLQNSYLILWPLEELYNLNREYNIDEFAPGFFILGSDGGDTAFVIDKQTGEFHQMPFIGMSQQEAVFIAKDFAGFIEALDKIQS
jgi:hypothetical protein